MPNALVGGLKGLPEAIEWAGCRRRSIRASVHLIRQPLARAS